MSGVQGNRESGASDRGSPVKVGGRYNSTQPSLTDGQRGDLQIDERANLKVTLFGASQTSGVRVDTPADSLGTGNVGLQANSFGFRFNGSTWDRARGNIDGTALASAARTASVDSADLTNYNAKGLHLVIDVTAITATPGITVTVQGKDALSGKYYTILASASITTVSTTVLKVHPGLTAAANAAANDILPRTWRVSVVNADADSITYSIGYSLVV